MPPSVCCTSMLIGTMDNGRKPVCGLHGGLGTNGLSHYRKADGSRGAFIAPVAWRERMEIQVEKLKTIM